MRLPSTRLLLVSGATLLAVVIVGYGITRLTTSEPETTTTSPPVTTSPVPPPQEFGFTSADADTSSALSATVTWKTTTPSTGAVAWGPTGMRPLLWRRVTGSATTHVVRLDGLGIAKPYTVAVEATSADGEVARTTIAFTSAAAPATVTPSVADGVVRVNGGAFFPFMTWQECPDSWPPEIEQGITLFAGNPCTGIDSLVGGLGGRAFAAGTADDAAPAAPSSFVGWFYPDEADGQGMDAAALPLPGPGLRFLTLTSHFWSGAAPLPQGRGSYPGLLAQSDVIGFDLYPLQEYCRPDLFTGVFDAQQELAALAPGKATFQWIEVRAMKCPGTGVTEITPATIRLESWLAIAGGAHGLGFFPPDWGTEVGDTIAAIAARVAQLEPALLRPTLPVAADAPAVRASARELNGALYVIAANTAAQPTHVNLSNASLGDRIVSVVGSARTLTAHDGTLTDVLPALGVRIYAAP